MLKSVQNLVNSNSAMRCGNHAVKITNDGVKHFSYHDTVICTADPVAKVFTADNAGWNTQSTNRAVNDYKRYFSSHGYTEV